MHKSERPALLVRLRHGPQPVLPAKPCEFHVSRQARERYGFDEHLFSASGNVIFPNYHATRVFAQKMNDKRDLVNFPERAVRAGQINAMGLIDEILHYVAGLFREQVNRQVFAQALLWLDERLGAETVAQTLRRFVEDFPPLAVYKGDMAAQEFLQGQSYGVPNREIVLEEMLLLWLANANPAFSPFLELFDDSSLARATAYREMVHSLHEFFERQPRFGPDNQNLVDMLRSPAIAVPHSLSGQLHYMLARWGLLLGKYLYRLLTSLDVIKEEEKLRMAGGPVPTRVFEFSRLVGEPERFSPDREWMPRLVLMAKSTFVWLDQLSKKYQRPITRLDQIPDEELDRLAAWGFTGLWLIGIWERSKASRSIKRLCGNPEAEASAYALYDYEVAAELGGEEALRQLRARCWQRGIRLASDMVPNHMGIDSRWVVEHPEWFISLPYPPFPSYTFSGPDLSSDARMQVYIEDHYYTRTDAAVVFKRVDSATGEVRYIYHGNDGTSMPWNDTAQLNYLKPEVREAVMETILHVAGLFPIIRFDAAMTLTKRHYQRLWFPQPGSGGDIPSRAEHGMTKEQLDQLMPEEFWRQVVDRIAAQAPDTLLLAEAFWLMEGYFVRTLGMHRVYNSAFMNMLKNEENQKYRSVIKNTIEFNPEILKRYVNFMNNPDEQTAVVQFGKGDKYFGVCVMMVTMPGLPMFGHGQVEGFAEKYGMEYRRAYWDEQPDWDLVRRHEREIFPLLTKRYLFADVEHFVFYDFFNPEGQVSENVFAYSNRYHDERALVVYNNALAPARGWIRTSTRFLDVKGSRQLLQKSLGEGLALHAGEDFHVIFRDHVSGLEYLRSAKRFWEQGLYVELAGYQYHVFLDFREVKDDPLRRYAQLEAFLNGSGVPSIEDAMRELFLRPLHEAFAKCISGGTVQQLVAASAAGESEKEAAVAAAVACYREFVAEAGRVLGLEREDATLVERRAGYLQALLHLGELAAHLQRSRSAKARNAAAALAATLQDVPFAWAVLLSWLAVREVGRLCGEGDVAMRSRSFIDDWLLGKEIVATFQQMGFATARAEEGLLMVKILTSHQRWWSDTMPRRGRAHSIMRRLFADEEVQPRLGVNRYQDVLWFNKERFEELVQWLVVIAAVDALADNSQRVAQAAKWLRPHLQVVEQWRKAEQASAYQVERFFANLS
ncbi:MAG: alpha-amylase family glycosyl hydrolase [bacterium]|jgi:glycosidase|nr:alpha-amylase family glycosyl hydrolase [bacterium]